MNPPHPSRTLYHPSSPLIVNRKLVAAGLVEALVKDGGPLVRRAELRSCRRTSPGARTSGTARPPASFVFCVRTRIERRVDVVVVPLPARSPLHPHSIQFQVPWHADPWHLPRPRLASPQPWPPAPDTTAARASRCSSSQSPPHPALCVWVGTVGSMDGYIADIIGRYSPSIQSFKRTYGPWKVVSNLQVRQTMGFSSGRSKMAWHSAQNGTAPLPPCRACGGCARPVVAPAAAAMAIICCCWFMG